MKAEHRKELETNVLADRMGRALEGLKSKPQRGTMFIVVVGIVAVAVAFFGMRWYRMSKSENSEAWYLCYRFFEFADGTSQDSLQAARELQKHIEESHGDKAQGRFTRMQFNHRDTWYGILLLGADPKGSRSRLNRASAVYEEILKQSEDDPVLAPEAMYGMAIIEETLAIDDRKHLDRAMEMYEDLTKNKEYAKSAYAKLAEHRLETLRDDSRRREVNDVYMDLQRMMRFDLKK